MPYATNGPVTQCRTNGHAPPHPLGITTQAKYTCITPCPSLGPNMTTHHVYSRSVDQKNQTDARRRTAAHGSASEAHPRHLEEPITPIAFF